MSIDIVDALRLVVLHGVFVVLCSGLIVLRMYMFSLQGLFIMLRAVVCVALLN